MDTLNTQMFHITPSKGSLKRNINPADVPYSFGAEYSINAFYPAELATMSEPYNLRNARGVAIQVSPYQYNPVTKVLRVLPKHSGKCYH